MSDILNQLWINFSDIYNELGLSIESDISIESTILPKKDK